MTEEEIYKRRDDAWGALSEKLGTGVTVRLTQPLYDAWKHDWETNFPNIKTNHYKNEPPTYESTLEGFPSWLFRSKIEAHLANTLFLAYKSTGKEFRREKLQAVFQMVLALFEIESNWRF